MRILVGGGAKSPCSPPCHLEEAVRRLKPETGRGMAVGGVRLALGELGLIDEYEFVVHPRLTGHGPTLFAGLAKAIDPRLVGRHDSGSGAVALRYQPAGTTSPASTWISFRGGASCRPGATGASPWASTSMAAVTLTSTADRGTDLVLTHRGVPKHLIPETERAWREQYWLRMKAYLARAGARSS